jgi:hypothetical protein
MQTLATTLDQVMSQWIQSIPPTIKPELYRGQNRKWTIRLIEVWPDDEEDVKFYTGSSPLDERVEWSFETLQTWKTAHRTAWDMWCFDNKRDAEKFITLYTLTWAQ